MTKRSFDIIMSIGGLLVLSPLFFVVSALIKLDSKGPVFFKQERVGRNFHVFFIYKFRTMAQDAWRRGPPITCGEDPRITHLGRFLRKSKIDELPQLINVLKGEMSLVGPRPEIPRYVEMTREEYAEILKVRPGMTDLASLKYRDEAAILGKYRKPEEEYVQHLLPEKIALAREYIERSSLLFDISLVVRTIFGLFWKKDLER